MKKTILMMVAALACAAFAATAETQPLRDARRVTAAQSATITNSFAEGICTLDRVEVVAAAPATGTFTLRHIWTEDALTFTNAYTVAYTNTAAAQLEITNAWPLHRGDLIVGDFGSVATGRFAVGRSKLLLTPAR